MSYAMTDFEHAGVKYQLLHFNGDDSRAVTTRQDPTTALMRFDCSLNVSRNGEVIGHLSGVNDVWSLVRDTHTTILGIPVNDYSWVKIMEAEVAAFKAIMEDEHVQQG
jgi:hypothetical protein